MPSNGGHTCKSRTEGQVHRELPILVLVARIPSLPARGQGHSLPHARSRHIRRSGKDRREFLCNTRRPYKHRMFGSANRRRCGVFAPWLEVLLLFYRKLTARSPGKTHKQRNPWWGARAFPTCDPACPSHTHTHTQEPHQQLTPSIKMGGCGNSGCTCASCSCAPGACSCSVRSYCSLIRPSHKSAILTLHPQK
jgi:hypothetical protein